VTMVEIPPDNYDNLYYHQSDGQPPLENIMGEVQHQQATLSSAMPESDQENDGNEALNTANPSAKNYYLLFFFRNNANHPLPSGIHPFKKSISTMDVIHPC
jgi:hypothetical protein